MCLHRIPTQREHRKVWVQLLFKPGLDVLPKRMVTSPIAKLGLGGCRCGCVWTPAEARSWRRQGTQSTDAPLRCLCRSRCFFKHWPLQGFVVEGAGAGRLSDRRRFCTSQLLQALAVGRGLRAGGCHPWHRPCRESRKRTLGMCLSAMPPNAVLEVWIFMPVGSTSSSFRWRSPFALGPAVGRSVTEHRL